MGRIIFIFILLLTSQFCLSQLQFEGSIFPSQGDSLTYHKDVINIPDNFVPGDDQSWDFRFLETPLYYKESFDASDFYPSTNHAGSAFLFEKGKIKFICDTENNDFLELGFVLPLPRNNQKVRPVFYKKAISISGKSLKHNAQQIQKGAFAFELTRDELPVIIRQDIPDDIELLKIRGTKTVNRISDAWGTLVLPREAFKANRIKVIERVDLKIYNAKTGKAISYFDEDMLFQILPIKKVSRSYEFYSNKYDFVTARIDIDNNGNMTTIDYQSDKVKTESINTTSKRSDFVLYPNPTYNIAKVFISNKSNGKYALAIYNIIGKKLWHKDIEVNGPTIVKENFGFLPKGTYLLSLLDENGNIIRTTRLIIISV